MELVAKDVGPKYRRSCSCKKAEDEGMLWRLCILNSASILGGIQNGWNDHDVEFFSAVNDKGGGMCNITLLCNKNIRWRKSRRH